MKKSFNVIIATAGRPTLIKMLESILPQLEKQDYLTILWDCKPNIQFPPHVCTVIQKVNPEPLGFWGHGSRNRWQDELPGDYFMNGDDDDVYTPDAMAAIREKCTDKKLYIFQFLHSGIRIPQDKELKVGNIGTSCGVYPKISKFPKWEYRYGGDGEFYIALSKLLPYEHVKKVIYVVRPDKREEFEVIPDSNQVYCECGKPANMTYDKMFGVWRGHCYKCDKSV